MAPKHNDQNQEALRRRRQAQRRRQVQRERRRLLLRLTGVGIIALAVGIMIFMVQRNAGDPSLQSTPETTVPPQTQQTEPPSETEPTELPEFSTIHIAAVGDLNITDTVLQQNLTEDGYDFSQAFLDVAPVLSQADLTLLNFEGNLTGAPYGGTRRSAPQEMAQALADIGVDVVQTANSASILDGVLGLKATKDAFASVGIETVGTFRDSADFRSSKGYTIVEVEGFRVALVAFTKGMDNMGLPEGSEDCVNLLYTDYTTDYKSIDTDGINSILRSIAEDQPDITIAMVHWGSEYNESISDTQTRIRNLMLSGGVDIILGTHPHLVQTIEFDETAGTLAAFSLGDFYGDASQAGSNYSLILDIEVQRDNLTGEVKVAGYTYTPIYTLTPTQSSAGGHRVVRIKEAMARYESNYLGCITEDTYDSMAYALTRLEQRIAQEAD